MTIRSKLSVALLAMFGMLLGSTAIVTYSVKTISNQALNHAQMRQLSVFTDDVRAEIFYETAVDHGFGPLRDHEDWWPEDVLEDIGVRINLAGNEFERVAWTRVRDDVKALAAMTPRDPESVPLVMDADRQLRKLRRDYDRLVADAVAKTADVASLAHIIVVATALLSCLLFILMTLLIRDWLVKPVEILNQAADEIGRGNLEHRVPLQGRDELAHLARRIDMMAHRLGEHQTQLVEAREMAAIGELCTNVAHGLRNPLAGMRAAAQLALRRFDDPQKLRNLFDDIIHEIDRMDRRITQIFEFSRLCALNTEATCFRDLILDAEAEARGVVSARVITLETEDQTGETTWHIDRQKLASAVGELITNAAHHSDEGATVTVSGNVTPRSNGTPARLNIFVTDRGRGIGPNALTQLFDLFYTTRQGGSGMGLPLVKRIVRQHNGTIDVKSTPGEGTRVRVTLECREPNVDSHAYPPTAIRT